MTRHDIYFLVIVFAALWGGHYAPWHIAPILLNDRGQLHRPIAYAYGCLVILLGFALFAIYHAPTVGVWYALAFLALDILAAGAGTMLPRVLRLLVERRALEADKRDLEELVGGPSEPQR